MIGLRTSPRVTPGVLACALSRGLNVPQGRAAELEVGVGWAATTTDKGKVAASQDRGP